MIDFSRFKRLVQDVIEKKVNPTSVKVATLKQYYKGTRHPSRKVMIDFCRSTGKSFDWLIGLSEASELNSNKEEFKFMLDLSILNEENQKKFRNNLDCLKKHDSFDKELNWGDGKLPHRSELKGKRKSFNQNRCYNILSCCGLKCMDYSKIVDGTVGYKAVNSWVNSGTPSVENMKMLCRCLQISSDYLIGLSDNPNLQQDPSHELVSVASLLRRHKADAYKYYGQYIYEQYSSTKEE